MNKIIELYTHGSHSFVISTIAAGRIGASDERYNPNRVKLLKSLGIDPQKVFSAVQYHTKDVIDTSDWRAEPQSQADGIMSSSRDSVLGVTVADCMPIYLHDDKRGIRALLHSGWKGTGIVLEALAMMNARYGCSAGDTVAVLGPAIGSCCYNVDQQRAELFGSMWGPDSVIENSGKFYLSLKKANADMLKLSGIGEVIDRSICTCCSDSYGSFRREGPENFTQMIALSYLNQRN